MRFQEINEASLRSFLLQVLVAPRTVATRRRNFPSMPGIFLFRQRSAAQPASRRSTMVQMVDREDEQVCGLENLLKNGHVTLRSSSRRSSGPQLIIKPLPLPCKPSFLFHHTRTRFLFLKSPRTLQALQNGSTTEQIQLDSLPTRVPTMMLPRFTSVALVLPALWATLATADKYPMGTGLSCSFLPKDCVPDPEYSKFCMSKDMECRAFRWSQ